MSKKVFLALFSVVFSAQLGMGIIAPLMPVYADSMNASGLQLGFMYAGFNFSSLICGPIAGWFSDKQGRKIFMIAGLGAYSVISILYAFAENMIQLTSIRFLHGAASALVIPIAQAYIGDLIPSGREGHYGNLFSMSIFIGMGTGPMLGGMLTDTFSTNTAFFSMSGFSVLSLVLLFRLVPSVDLVNPVARARRTEPRAPIRIILRNNILKGVGISLASRAFYRQAIIAFLPLLVITKLDISQTEIGIVLSAYIICSGLFQGMAGSLVDRFDKRLLILLGNITAPSFIFFIPTMTTSIGILILLLPSALLGSIARAATVAIRVQIGKQYNAIGTVGGTTRAMMRLAQILGPLLFGFVMDNNSIHSTFRLGSMIAMVLTLPVAYFLYKDSREETAWIAPNKEAT